MIIEWVANWYELDQCIVVGDIDYFYVSNDNCFASSFDKDAYEVRAEIVSISHTQLGRIKGIIAIGLDYTIYLCDGRELCVNAEEFPGEVENETIDIKEWKFDVNVKILEKTGYTYNERFSQMKPSEINDLSKQLKEKYKSLLGILYASWESD